VLLDLDCRKPAIMQVQYR